MFDVFISGYVFVYTQTLADVVCNNIAAVFCVVGLVIVVALGFVFFLNVKQY